MSLLFGGGGDTSMLSCRLNNYLQFYFPFSDHYRITFNIFETDHDGKAIHDSRNHLPLGRLSTTGFHLAEFRRLYTPVTGALPPSPKHRQVVTQTQDQTSLFH